MASLSVMSLSFREHAAIALSTAYTIRSGDAHSGDARSGEEFARGAQKLADECCAVWGHDQEEFFLSYPGAGTIAAGGISQTHMRCRRCGATKK